MAGFYEHSNEALIIVKARDILQVERRFNQLSTMQIYLFLQ
jgi:hypothetical protein